MQKLMEVTLQGLTNAYVYLDDILLFSKNEQEHVQLLTEVFKRLEKNHMPLSVDKCTFGQSSVEYLGYRVDATGIKPLQRKLEALHNFKEPSSQKDLLHFLGALNYFRSSFKGLTIEGQFQNTAQILQPLYNAATAKLEKISFKNMWSQSPALKVSFNRAKQLLINATQLTHPNPNNPMAICVDASDHSIGGSLEMQDPVSRKWLPLGFFSRHLNQSQKKYSVFKKELYAAHQSLRFFLPEIKGKEIAIFSDHLPLCQAMDSENIPLHDPQTYRQLMEIAQFTRDIRHVSGKNNVMADFLTRGGANPKIGDIYKETDDAIEIAATQGPESTAFQTITLQAIEELQAECPETKSCKQGLHPRNFKFEDQQLNEKTVFC